MRSKPRWVKVKREKTTRFHEINTRFYSMASCILSISREIFHSWTRAEPTMCNLVVTLGCALCGVIKCIVLFEKLLQELRAFREDTNLRFETIDKKLDKMDSDFKDLKDWVGMVVGGFQRRAGRSLEDAVAGTLRIALGRDVKPENITMRKIEDG